MRLFLINLLVAGVIVALIRIGIVLSGLVLNFTSLSLHQTWDSVVSYCGDILQLIVRYNKKEMKTLHIVLFLALIWCVSIYS